MKTRSMMTTPSDLVEAKHLRLTGTRNYSRTHLQVSICVVIAIVTVIVAVVIFVVAAVSAQK